MKRWLILSVLAVALICCGCSSSAKEQASICTLSKLRDGPTVYIDYVMGVKLTIPYSQKPMGRLYSISGWNSNDPIKFFDIYMEKAFTGITQNKIHLYMNVASSYPWDVKAGDEVMEFSTAAGQSGTIRIRKMPAIEENTISHTYEDANGELKVWYESARGEYYSLMAKYSQCEHNIFAEIDCDDYEYYFDFVYQLICSLELIEK